MALLHLSPESAPDLKSVSEGVCAFREPKTIRINLNGTLSKGVYAKDVILYVIGQLGVNGATDRVLEFRGPVVEAMTMESRMTLSNMAIEAGGHGHLYARSGYG
jgi:3-isopropylmalate/(R)-2-methylmalate dehydratase large subunit